jgi:hypothetical protein
MSFTVKCDIIVDMTLASLMKELDNNAALALCDIIDTYHSNATLATNNIKVA